MLDLLIKNASLPDGRTQMSVAVQDGRITAVEPGLDAPAHETVDAGGHLLSPPFVDPHFHMDATLSYGLPRINESGTLLEGIAVWGELKPTLKLEAIIERALTYCDWAVAKGLLAIRSHVDTSDASLLAVDALLEVKKQVTPYIDLQLVAFPQDGVLRSKGGIENLKRALDRGVDIVGGIPHFERTMTEGAASVKLLCEIAAERGLPVDMHCDESDDPLSRHIETLAFEAQRLGLQGRVNGSHCTSMHSMDNYYVSKLLPLIAESGVSVIANPLINITLQGRHDSYPKRRGMTRVPELMAAGINVAFGHDCVMDPWYGLGSGDMLEVAHMGLHVAQMTSQKGIRDCFDAVTVNAAKVMHLQGYGIAPGCEASFVLLQAQDVVEAIRLRANRLRVWKKGVVLAETPKVTAALCLTQRPSITCFVI
ncbi:MAG: amidohydrolase family protein [Polaromonas sp.]|uniref:amidohydrolase family protein n=1 Tax=Polaromonas sp. TaxID=1869339 RepID=UPI002731CC3F|nr:amidohydrolase family protein [Polaromonas sp.]MDP2451590.1 amidohydrolase family protein [Polaromonas sp.]MDP3246684.1 amidohydrolase family protein [Polaromonas sp.]MDP3754657.1 amidohydrolase family protein [Polaromonas sp.]